MCKLCDDIRNECSDNEGDEFICKCPIDGTINFVWVDVDTCSPVCFPVKYCHECGEKLDGMDSRKDQV